MDQILSHISPCSGRRDSLLIGTTAERAVGPARARPWRPGQITSLPCAQIAFCNVGTCYSKPVAVGLLARDVSFAYLLSSSPVRSQQTTHGGSDAERFRGAQKPHVASEEASLTLACNLTSTGTPMLPFGKQGHPSWSYSKAPVYLRETKLIKKI